MIKDFLPNVDNVVSNDSTTNNHLINVINSNKIPKDFNEFYDIFWRLNSFARNNIIRMIVTPILYIATILTLFIISIDNSFEANYASLAVVVTIPIFNAVLWVLTDPKCLEGWKSLLTTGKYNKNNDNSLISSDRESDINAIIEEANNNPLNDSFNNNNNNNRMYSFSVK